MGGKAKSETSGGFKGYANRKIETKKKLARGDFKGYGKDQWEYHDKAGVWDEAGKQVKKVGTTKTKDYNVPDRPDLLSYNKPTQTVISQRVIDRARQNIGGVDLNRQGLEAIRAQALGNSADSPWLKMQLEQLEKQKGFDIDELGAASAGREAQARASLSSKGGLSGGAAERLAGSSARQGMMDRQGLNREAMMGRLGLSTTAEEQKQDMLRNLPGMELGASNFDLGKQQYLSNMEYNKEQDDLNASLREAQRQGDINQTRYLEQMKDMAAAKQANAIQRAGQRGGGWLGALYG